VPEAPVFPFPVWSVWRDDLDPALAATAQTCLAQVAASLDDHQTEVIDLLRDLNSDGEVDFLRPGMPLEE
jgi:hypothetical protein